MIFEPRYLVCLTTTGEYRIERTESGDWHAQWVGPGNASLDRWSRPLIAIDARDADGNAHDWDSSELAQEACRRHRFLMCHCGPQEAADAVGRRMYDEQAREGELMVALEEA